MVLLNLMFFCHRDRVGISKTELVSMLEEEELKDAVLVVLANKQVILKILSVLYKN